MPSWRGFTKRAFQCGLYEAQDVLAESDDVDLLLLRARKSLGFRQRWQRRLLYRDITRRLIYINPGLEPVRLKQDYECFVVVCQNYWDLLYVNAIEGWQDRCKTSVVWIDELWAGLIPEYRYWLHALNRFDHVFVGYSGSVGPATEALGRVCHWMPGAVDAFRFSPYPDPPPRVVDVYSIGRRWEGVHRELLRLAAAKQLFYIHDTFSGSDVQPSDHKQHRDMFANLAKRSRYFMVAPGKMDLPGERSGQIEVGYRYFEGAAAGAVLIGQTPDCPAFQELFGWPEAVIDIKADGSDVGDVLAELARQPERVRGLGQRNAVQSLLRHDWIHRWKKMFQIAGIKESPGMIERERRLKEIAAAAKIS